MSTAFKNSYIDADSSVIFLRKSRQTEMILKKINQALCICLAKTQTRRKSMDTLYASVKDNIILEIERSSFSTYAKIDFRKADSFGLCLKKHVHSYQRLLSDLNFTPFTEEPGLMLFVHKERNTSPFPDLFKLKETLDECIMTMEREYV